MGDGGNNTDQYSPVSVDLGTGPEQPLPFLLGLGTPALFLTTVFLKCWGYDAYGQLGNGGSNTNTDAPSATAIDLGAGRTAVAVAAGEAHTCAILKCDNE